MFAFIIINVWFIMIVAMFGAMITEQLHAWLGNLRDGIENPPWADVVIYGVGVTISWLTLFGLYTVSLSIMPVWLILAIESGLVVSYYWINEKTKQVQEGLEAAKTFLHDTYATMFTDAAKAEVVA